ncbi:restriction endonuclease subunit S [Streptomyces laurentii]|uniref:restriction endonuclease subunit S n=1 Tax=Streptomyces laurentii TaxID=39478 RepID=UPI0036D18A6D
MERPCVLDPNLMAVEPLHDQLDGGYLHHWFRSFDLSSIASGSSIPQLNKKDLNGLRLPLPPILVQRRTAALLDHLDELRAKRRKAIALLDSLGQSIFQDMFGDPVKLLPGATGESLGVLAKIQTGPFGSLLHQEDYVQDGVPIVNPQHIVDGVIATDGRHSVSPAMAKSLSVYRLKVGDIVMGRRGEMGRCAIVGAAQDGFICGTGSMVIRPTGDTVLGVYLARVLSHPSMKRHLERVSLGTTMANLNQKIVADLSIYCPPLSEQRAFEVRVSQIELLKENQLSYLSELDALFSSLRHRAFRGELWPEDAAPAV